MDRRSFLSGTLKAITTSGIVIAAANMDIDAFAKKAVVGDRMVADVPEPGCIDLGGMLYDSTGRPVAIIERIEHHMNPIDSSAYGDPFARQIRGLSHIRISAISYGPVKLLVGGK